MNSTFEFGWIDAGGWATRSLRSGIGAPVIFLHGTSGHLEAFARNIPSHAAQYRCHAIDMLGHGFTAKPAMPYEIPQYVEHLTKYMDAQGIQSAHLVGESLGGWVAAWLASEQPERVSSLQLLCSGGTKANPTVMERIRESTRKAVLAGDIELTRARLQLLMHDKANATEELVQVRHAIYSAPEFRANIDNLLTLQNYETRVKNLLTQERMKRITAPTMIIWGDENPFGGIEEAKMMNEWIPGSRLQSYAECGHWPQHEHSARYNEESLAFLRSASRS